MSKNNHPQMLAFAQAISPSDFMMYACSSGQQTPVYEPVEVRRVSVRGTKINYLAPNKRGDADTPNLQRVDVATLPPHCDSLMVAGSVKFLPHALAPWSVNEQNLGEGVLSFQDAYAEFVKGYKEIKGFHRIAEHVFMNMASGVWLWRNADSALSLRTTVEIDEMPLFEIAREQIAPDMRLHLAGIKNPEKQEQAKGIVNAMALALSGDAGAPLTVKLSGTALMGEGQTVYPSQEFIENNKEKVLASRSTGECPRHAYIHTQKIGNALRTWDMSYEQEAAKPIALEPYGVDQARQFAFRKNKNGFYDYIEHLQTYAGKDDPVTHYVMGCFIRGGVFGKKADS